MSRKWNFHLKLNFNFNFIVNKKTNIRNSVKAKTPYRISLGEVCCKKFKLVNVTKCIGTIIRLSTKGADE